MMQSEEEYALVYSSERKTDMRQQLGTAHYSYRFVEERFVKLFRRMGASPQLIELPEALKHAAAFRGLGLVGSNPLVHLIFRSTENIRPINAARNICHFAWEFDVLSSHTLSHESITHDQVHMLNIVDEVWTPCSYSKEVLERHGVRNVHVVPTPVSFDDDAPRLSRDDALSTLSEVLAVPYALCTSVGHAGNRDIVMSGVDRLVQHPLIQQGGKVFLTICNPGDMRKNLLNTIDGFLIGTRPIDLLVVKLLIPNTGDFLARGVYEKLSGLFRGPACAASDRVVFLLEFLSDAEMGALYSLADFYLSAPHCEGYNLPLLEAMSKGTVPVSNCHTAMADYIDATNSVLIEHMSYMGLIMGMAGDVAGRNYAVPLSDRYQIAAAVNRATRLSDQEYARLALSSKERVLASHSEQSAALLVAERLKQMSSGREGK